ncbi:MAG: hypothetical protein MSA09_05070 [Lachnospiraceae bacterium]|nr:hypothetical protein [Lachnospiraceae bacterium]
MKLRSKSIHIVYHIFSLIFICCFIISGLALTTSAATKLNINLSNNQTFFILPGTDSTTYDVAITSGGELGNVTCSSSNLEVATIDDMGKMILKDAGSTKIKVTSGNKSVTRTINVLVRSDWSKVVSVKNASKLTVKDHVLTVSLKNHMDFPIRMIYSYNTYTDAGSLIQSNASSSPIYLAANASFTYKVMMPEDVSYVSVNSATFEYNQFGCKKIDTKKVTVKESTDTDRDNKYVKYKVATLKNSNKNQVILPYYMYLYDQNGKLISVEYKTIPLAGKQKTVLREVYQTKDPHAERYTAKVVYKFSKPIPYF